MSRQARILLVDDRAENLVALEAILAPLNQILVPVRSGEQALQAAGDQEFAVVLLDIVMPGMDGFETAAQIKSRAKNRDVPIILLTAKGEEIDKLHGFRLGVDDPVVARASPDARGPAPRPGAPGASRRPPAPDGPAAPRGDRASTDPRPPG